MLVSVLWIQPQLINNRWTYSFNLHAGRNLEPSNPLAGNNYPQRCLRVVQIERWRTSKHSLFPWNTFLTNVEVPRGIWNLQKHFKLKFTIVIIQVESRHAVCVFRIVAAPKSWMCTCIIKPPLASLTSTVSSRKCRCIQWIPTQQRAWIHSTSMYHKHPQANCAILHTAINSLFSLVFARWHWQTREGVIQMIVW